MDNDSLNQVGPNVTLYESPGGKLQLHKSASINAGTQIRAVGADVIIGHKVGIGYNCFLVTSYGSHYLGEHAAKRKKPIVIKGHSWIGHGAMIRGGVTIGPWSVVGMGAVVLNDVPPFAIAVGNPAKIVGVRPDIDLVLAQMAECCLCEERNESSTS